MVVNSMKEYEQRAVELANSLSYDANGRGRGELQSLRRRLIESRDKMPLFDTLKWTRDVESAYQEMWRRWVEGTEFETSEEYEQSQGPEKQSGCIWVK